jgi:hypothetical protein
MSGSVSLAPTNDRHDADRLHRFAVLCRIEILHILLEHYCDSQCNRNAGSARRRLSSLGYFQRRVAIVGSVAHLVAKDPDSLLAMSRGSGNRGKVHPRDEQEAVSQLPCQRQDGAAVGRGYSLGSHLTQTTQICFEAHRPPLRVRLLVSRCGGRRSSGDTHGPCLRLPLHCQACQRSLTRKRSLVQIQYRPPVILLVRPALRHIYRLRSSTS